MLEPHTSIEATKLLQHATIADFSVRFFLTLYEVRRRPCPTQTSRLRQFQNSWGFGLQGFSGQRLRGVGVSYRGMWFCALELKLWEQMVSSRPSQASNNWNTTEVPFYDADRYDWKEVGFMRLNGAQVVLLV